MADFGDFSSETDDGTGQERQTAGPDLAIRRGLLSPSGFPSILPGGATAEANGSAIAPRPPILGGPLDQDVHAEVLQDILDAQARLPPLALAQGSGDPANWDGGWLDPPAPLITGPLDADTHAEVLRDIQNAQARLPALSPGSAYSVGNSVRSSPSSPSSPYGLGTDGGGGRNNEIAVPGFNDSAAGYGLENLPDHSLAAADTGSSGSSWGGPVQLPGPLTKASAASVAAGAGSRSVVGPVLEGLGALAEGTQAAIALPILAGGAALFGFSDTGDHTEDARLADQRSVSESRARPGQVDPSLQTTSRSARAAIASQLSQGNMQAHHLVPAEVWGEFNDVAKLAQQAGWNPDSPENLIALPADSATQAKLASQGVILPIHNRSHAKYSGTIKKIIEEALDEVGWMPTPSEARTIMERAAAMALDQIRDGIYNPAME